MANPTRKSIGDKRGLKSVYVVEVEMGGDDGTWEPYWGDDNAPSAYHQSYRYAVKAKYRIYHLLKAYNCNAWTRDRFRIRLYARVEG